MSVNRYETLAQIRRCLSRGERSISQPT